MKIENTPFLLKKRLLQKKQKVWKVLALSCFLCWNAIAEEISQPFPLGAWVQAVGPYYGFLNKQKELNYFLSPKMPLGKIIEAIDQGVLSAEDVLYFTDFDSTLVVKSEETPNKASSDGTFRGGHSQPTPPSDSHKIKNMRFVIDQLNQRQIPWVILTARPDIKDQHGETGSGIEEIKQEVLKAGVPSNFLETFLSPAAKNLQINIQGALRQKFKAYWANEKSQSELLKQGEIPKHKINDSKIPSHEGNIILISHMPKAWALYFFLKQMEENGKKIPRYVFFADDSKNHMFKIRDSIEENVLELNKKLALDLPPLGEFKDKISFILLHYARSSDQTLNFSELGQLNAGKKAPGNFKPPLRKGWHFADPGTPQERDPHRLEHHDSYWERTEHPPPHRIKKEEEKFSEEFEAPQVEPGNIKKKKEEDMID